LHLEAPQAGGRAELRDRDQGVRPEQHHRVSTTDATLRDHRSVIRRVYRRDPSFVHPDAGFLRRLLSGRAAYLRHGAARAFAVRDEAFAVAFVDPRLQEKTGRAVGSIGFFEAASQHGAVAVLDAACDWLRRNDVTEA